MSENQIIKPTNGQPSAPQAQFDVLNAIRRGGGEQPAAAPTLRPNSILNRMAPQAPEQGGEPAAPEQPAAPAAPAPTLPPKAKVRFRHQDIELSHDDLVKFAQKGLAADKLEERRQQVEREQRDNEARLAVVRDLELLRQTHPERFQAALDVMRGVQPARREEPAGDPLDEPLTPQARQAQIPTEWERRIAALEARYNQTEQALHQRDRHTRVERALSSQAYLNENPEAGDVARRLLESSLAAGEFETPEDAAPIIAAQVKRLVEGHLEVERKARQSRADAAVPRTPSGAPQIPRLDPKYATRKALKDGSAVQGLRGLMSSFRQALNGTNQSV
jgi:hypothetical protein